MSNWNIDVDWLRKELMNAQVGSPVAKVMYRDRPLPTVKKVVFNPPATIIIWNDGSKSVVKAQNGEPFDHEKGFVMAYLKKLLGNDNTFNKEITKWVKWEEQKQKTKVKPLTTDEIRKTDRKRLWLVSLDDACEERHNHVFNGWHTVDLKADTLIDESSEYGEFYYIKDNDTPCGFHAYLEPPEECSE